MEPATKEDLEKLKQSLEHKIENLELGIRNFVLERETALVWRVAELELFFKPDLFKPFVITLVDGYAIPVEKFGDALLGMTMIVAKDPLGYLIHIPFHAIAHISEYGKEIG